MSDLVIDASVAIKWVIEEEGTAEALTLRRQHLIAPDLIIPECANILWKKVRRDELSAEEASLAGRLLANADIDLALAEQSNLKFVTADSRLIAKGRTFERFRWRFAELR